MNKTEKMKAVITRYYNRNRLSELCRYLNRHIAPLLSSDEDGDIDLPEIYNHCCNHISLDLDGKEYEDLWVEKDNVVIIQELDKHDWSKYRFVLRRCELRRCELTGDWFYTWQ